MERSMSSNSSRGPSTKDKLSSIVQGFDDFDTEMKRGTRLRREKDEFRITELKNHMHKLEQELQMEVKRRTEMNKSTQLWFEDQLEKLNKDFHTLLAKRKEDTDQKIEALNQRITSVQAYFEEQKAAVLKYVDDRGEELTKLLNQFKAEFDEDRRLRLEREEVIVKQLTDHEQEVAEKFQQQIESRENRYNTIKNILEENIKIRDKTESKFAAFFEREVNILKNDYRVEKETREREDDEIIEALNRYTIKLQNSLKVVNSTDM